MNLQKALTAVKIVKNDSYLIETMNPNGKSRMNTLMSPLKWNDIGSNIIFSTDGSTITNQIQPTYDIFNQQPDGSYQQTDVREEASDPSACFSANPYPPGPAPFIPQ